MRTLLLILLTSVTIFSCKKQSEKQQEINNRPVDVQWIRFDKKFAKATQLSLKSLKSEFPYLFPKNITDTQWLQKNKDSLYKEVTHEVAQKFDDTNKLEAELKSLFQHIEYHFNEHQSRKIIGLISDMDTQNRIIYADTLILIGLDTYLGKSHRFYKGFDTYTLDEFEPQRIVIDLAEAFARAKNKQQLHRDFISNIIYEGSILYAIEKLLPQKTDEQIIGYSKEQLNWAQANETQIWKYFIENNLLYSSDIKLNTRFIQKAPFSKFYLELDKDSPGKIGTFIGWQIVKAYMKNNTVTLPELLHKNSKEIFDNSNYKPQK